MKTLRCASLFLLAAAIAILPTPGCASPAPASGAPAAPPAAPVVLEGAEWRCTMIDGKKVEIAAERAPNLTFDANGRVHGYAGVNRYFGECAHRGDAVKFDKLGSTRMAGPPERMALEDSFLKALGRVDACAGDAHALRLSAGGAVILEFTR
jgi:heat shock protein HslJ